MLARINWKPSEKDLRKFGVTLIVGFALIGALVGWRKSWEAASWIWGVSAGIGLLALFLPAASKPFYLLWMGIAFIMGTIISTVILILIFYLIITPVGILMRVLGRDSLHLKKASFKSGTYWHSHPEKFDKTYYQRLF